MKRKIKEASSRFIELSQRTGLRFMDYVVLATVNFIMNLMIITVLTHSPIKG